MNESFQESTVEDPYSLFVFAMNAPQTREKYITRLDRFFRFINVQGTTIEERCRSFAEIANKNDNNKWVLNSVLKFLQIYKDRVDRKEISGATLRNYVKSIKLFCEMNDILIPWKKITRGLPRGRKFADDRAPTIEEIYIHRLLLMLSINKQYYEELAQNEGHINRAKRHEEIIGRRHVIYTFSPNGTVEIAVKSSDTPFKLETEEDESVISSFFGQVRDRLLYHVSDIRERHIPPIMEWVLKGCDLNKDVEIQDNCQMTLPDIQLKHADRVFRLYVKSLHNKAVYRSEESLAPSRILPKALENIAHPHRSIENKVDELSKQLKHFMGSFPKCNCSHHSCISSESQANWSTGKGQGIRNSAQLDDGNSIVKGAGK